MEVITQATHKTCLRAALDKLLISTIIFSLTKGVMELKKEEMLGQVRENYVQ